MIEISKRRRRKFCCDLTLKECIECGSSLLLPLMLGVFTIVITLHQTNVAGQQRLEDRHIAKEERQQDLNISAQQRLDDRKQAEEQRQLDKKISQDQFKLNEEQRQHEVNIAYMQYRDNLLIDYIKDIGVLLKENNGSLTNDYVTKTIVRAKTLAIIRQLDPIRNVELIRFLYEAGQLTRNRNPLDLSTAQLQNIDFRNALYWNMPGLSLVGTHLFNASFAYNTLVDVDFRRSNLTGVNFTMTSLRSCTFDKALLEKTIFTHSTMCKVSFKYVKLIDTNFANATVTKADFSGAELPNTNFSNAYLMSANFTGARLTNTDFTNATLISAMFRETLISNSTFIYTHASETFFTDTFMFNNHFESVSFSHCFFHCYRLCYYHSIIFNNSIIRRANFFHVQMGSSTIINSDLSLGVFTGTSFNGTRFLNTTMRNSNCTDIDLTSGQFIDSSFDNTIFTNATADYATFTRCKMSSVDLTGARLQNTWFSYTNLQNANFIDVNVNGINFSHTDLFNAKINDIQLLNAISIRGSRLPNGTYIDQDYNLITNGYADCNIPFESSWNVDENNSVAIIRSKQDENNCVFAPNKAIGPVRFYQKISDKYKQVRWELNPVLVLNARLGGQMTTITLGYPGHTYTMSLYSLY
ncbi:unnamed protein product [Adineta steineri]|uniref:Pentapeptide repeat-containing protein n=1 Tax=Adineta steineri TaxID=433720 RepID=A0A815ADH8_9BILA|nr:unnamed protein product [Adineta steineri]CAF1542763.1 unnamed protein product [Adineta steineri]